MKLSHARLKAIARAYHVPYWLFSDRPRPSWLRRPIWRLQAVLWRVGIDRSFIVWHGLALLLLVGVFLAGVVAGAA